MKKTLIAMAALAVVSAASAQSSVTLYGRLDIGYGSATTTTRDGSGQIRSRGVMDGAQTSNAIGFRGTEDLGGGLKANFVIEQGISPTSGNVFTQRAGGAGHQIDGFSGTAGATGLSGSAGAFTNSTNRQSYVGLSSDKVGTFNIGRQYNAFYEIATLSGYNIGSEGMIGADKAHLHGQAFTGIRGNMVQYISPNFGGGFVARVQYGTGDGRENFNSTAVNPANGLTAANDRRMALALQYANGPLSAGAAYTNVRTLQANGAAGTSAGNTTSAFGVITIVPTTTVLTGQSRTGNLFNIGASYDFGVAKVGGTYNRGRNTAGTVTVAQFAAGQTTGFNSNYRSYQMGVAVPFGAIVPFITYGRATTDVNDPNGVGATAAAAASNRTEDYRTYQIGVRYSLSKRTTAYAFYGQTQNNAAALAGATSFYVDKKTIVGVAHSF